MSIGATPSFLPGLGPAGDRPAGASAPITLGGSPFAFLVTSELGQAVAAAPASAPVSPALAGPPETVIASPMLVELQAAPPTIGLPAPSTGAADTVNDVAAPADAAPSPEAPMPLPPSAAREEAVQQDPIAGADLALPPAKPSEGDTSAPTTPDAPAPKPRAATGLVQASPVATVLQPAAAESVQSRGDATPSSSSDPDQPKADGPAMPLTVSDDTSLAAGDPAIPAGLPNLPAAPVAAVAVPAPATPVPQAPDPKPADGPEAVTVRASTPRPAPRARAAPDHVGGDSALLSTDQSEPSHDFAKAVRAVEPRNPDASDPRAPRAGDDAGQPNLSAPLASRTSADGSPDPHPRAPERAEIGVAAARAVPVDTGLVPAARSEAPAALPPQPSVPAREIGHGVGIAIAHAVDKGKDMVTVRLDPASLGRVEVRLSFDDRGAIRAVVTADSGAALDLLRQDSSQLGQALSDAGVRTDGQSFQFGSRSGGQPGHAPSHRQPDQPQPGHASGGELADDAPVHPLRRTLSESGNLDLIA